MDSANELLERFRRGDRRAMARLITLLDNDWHAHKLLDRLGRPRGQASVIGITGPPGVGKSTLLGGLIAGLRARGRRVAALAVDPESPISGGALLGDRLRLADVAARDPDVFIRSLSSRGVAGGLSASVRWICRLLEHADYDIVLLETVGVGQAEMAVLRVADLVLLMVMPGTGDSIQWEKAGLMEVAHLVVINKADHEGVDRIEQELRDAMNTGQGDAGSARQIPPILRTVASEGVGIEAVIDRLESAIRSRPPVDWHQVRTEILQEAEMLLGQRLRELADRDEGLVEMAHVVARRQQDLSSAASEVLNRLLPRLIDESRSDDQT